MTAKTNRATYDLPRKLKSDDTVRFGQWLWNLLNSGFEPKLTGFYDVNIAIADKLWNIQDSEPIGLIEGV